MKTLDLARFNKSRETEIPAGKFFFTIRRPTELDLHRATKSGGVSIEFASAQVVAWREVNESDLINGGDPEPLNFSADVFQVWIKDRSDLWKELVDGVVNAYMRHQEATEQRGNA